MVVDAAGGWVRHVAGLAGARVPVAAGPPPAADHRAHGTQVDPADPITRVADAAVYLRPARGGLMFGGFEPDPLPVDPRHQPASFTTDDVPLDLGVLRQLAAQITAEVPAASTAPVAEHRGGLFTMSPDGRFIAGPVPDLPGLWVASGCNGSGFSSSLAIGEALATWITSGAPPPGMTALSPGRFGPLPDDALLHPRALAVRPLLRPRHQHLARPPRRRARGKGACSGWEAAVVVPVTDFLRFRALEQTATPAELEDAEDTAAVLAWKARDAAWADDVRLPARAKAKRRLETRPR